MRNAIPDGCEAYRDRFDRINSTSANSNNSSNNLPCNIPHKGMVFANEWFYNKWYEKSYNPSIAYQYLNNGKLCSCNFYNFKKKDVHSISKFGIKLASDLIGSTNLSAVFKKDMHPFYNRLVLNYLRNQLLDKQCNVT